MKSSAEMIRQQAFFSRAGYLKLASAVDTNTIDETKRRIEDELSNPQPGFKTEYATGRPSKIYGVLQRDRTREVAGAVVKSPMLVNTLENILGPNVVTTLNRHNHASRNISGDNKYRFQKDLLQPMKSIVYAVVYLDSAELDTGCTWVVPSSHLDGRVGVPQPSGGGTWMDEHEEFDHLHDQALPVPAQPGDILLFDGMLFHTPGANTSNTARTSIVFGFRPVDELGDINDQRELLVTGNGIYRGNDRAV